MASPKIICKSAVIKDIAHFFNTIEYTGDKIAAQRIVYRDGSTREVNEDRIIKLHNSELEAVQGIQIDLKDGGSRLISYDRYLQKCTEREEVIRVSDMMDVQDDTVQFESGRALHAMRDLDFFRYLSYIEGRPGVEQANGHGLFGLGGNIPIAQAKQLAGQHVECPKWSHIISMNAHDATQTGFDSRAAWQQLIVSKAPKIAKAYNISLNNMVINCAYHANTDNPHVHLLFYSKDATEGFVKGGAKGMNEATEKLKSTIVTEIFKGETTQLGQEKHELRRLMLGTLHEQVDALMTEPTGNGLLDKLEHLSVELQPVKGKIVYEYLPADLKTRVDDILISAVNGSAQLSAAFQNYEDIHRKLISRYISSPARLEERVADWRERFWHPHKSDLRQHHNIIVSAAAALGASYNLHARTFENKTTDYATSAIELSSNSFVDSAAERRTFENKSTDYSMADLDLSSEDFGDMPPELRAFEGEKMDSSMTQQPVSTPNFNELDDYLGDVYTAALSQAFRSSLKNIFNPKVENTLLQTQMIQCLEMLRGLKDQEDEKCPEKDVLRKSIFSMLYSTDDEYRQSVDDELDNAADALTLKFGSEVSRSYVSHMRYSIHAGTSFYLQGVDDYANTLDDQRYYQILDAFKEFNKPLNRAIHKELSRQLIQSQPLQLLLRELQEVEPYMADKRCTRYAQSIIKQLLQELSRSAKPEYLDAIANYQRQYSEVIKKHMPLGKGNAYVKRFGGTFHNVLRIMRPHYTFVQTARQLDDMLYQSVVRSDEIQRPIKKLLKTLLDECLTDKESSSALWVQRQLEKIRHNGEHEDIAALSAFLYHMSPEFRKLADNQAGVLYEQLKQLMPAQPAAAFCAQYHHDLLHGNHLPAHSSIKWYAQCLDENIYFSLSKAHQEVFKELNEGVAKGLWNMLDDKSYYAIFRELDTLLCNPTENAGEIKELTRKVFLDILGEDELCRLAEATAVQFRQAIQGKVDANLALTLYERVQTDISTGDVPSTSYMVHSFVKKLNTHLAEKFLKLQLKHTAVATFRSNIYRAACRVLSKDSPQKEHLQLLTIDSHNRTCYNEILQILSLGSKVSLLECKGELYETLHKDYLAQDLDEPLEQKDFYEVLDSFFYGENGNTFFFQEPLTAETTALGMLSALFIAKSMTAALLHCILGAAARPHHAGDMEQEHAFAAQKQFQNLRFPPPQNFIQY